MKSCIDQYYTILYSNISVVYILQDTCVTKRTSGGFTGYSGPNWQYSSNTPFSYGVSGGPCMRILQNAEMVKKNTK